MVNNFVSIHDTLFSVSLGFLFDCFVPGGMIKNRHCVRPIYSMSSFLQSYELPFQKQESSDCSRPLIHQMSNESRTSITESLSEFFDAQEVLLSASSSENEVRTFMATLYMLCHFILNSQHHVLIIL